MSANMIIRSDNIMTCMEKQGCDSIIDGFIFIENGKIKDIGNGRVPKKYFSCPSKYIDARGKTVTPGLIDAHTHLIHGGSRENELAMKLAGIPYLEILKTGGGILSTVRSTRDATENELKIKAIKSLNQMLIHGTTTVEAKSGYGLDMDTELKCLSVAEELDREHHIDIIKTYMGAHAIPSEFKDNSAGYIKFMIEKVMPYIACHKIAEFVDVFCEDGAFSIEESRTILTAAKNLGFKLKIHADEIIPLKGAELAAEMRVVSAEHLMASSEQGMDDMSKAGVVAVLLPGTTFYLMSDSYAQARKMIEKGVRVALATDYNPGSCPTENLQEIMSLACMGMKLLPEEILKCMTINAAHAIDRANEIGSIEIGKKADIVIFDAPNMDYIVYHFGINHVDHVIKNGRIVVEDCKVL